MTPYRHRFDFDIGYLIKSPCRECADKELFPDCINTCLLLDRIHTALSNSVSCSKSGSSLEPYAVFNAVGEDK
ncbi:hypothetical protein LJC71_07045 [Desulfosarcina sp. OttesenSCG-928-A07]|nr:hypothetical protein [Desulfosarcina sp. OttesenSCG-928-G17]MDL2329481.1 hypothetical protein [Desulfosarcina sp. OttesenSCG-928-A07]